MSCLIVALVLLNQGLDSPDDQTDPHLVAKPDAHKTLVNPDCSHCRDEAKRRANELRDADPVLCWIRDTKGKYNGGAIPVRFFLNPYRVISDSYGVFVYDPDAGYARGFAPSYDFSFYGWRNGVMVMKHKDGTLYSCLSGIAFAGPRKGHRLEPVPTITSRWGSWLKHYPDSVAYHMYEKYQAVELPVGSNPDSQKSRLPSDKRLPANTEVLGIVDGTGALAIPIRSLAESLPATAQLNGRPLGIFHDRATNTAVAYRPVAVPPAGKQGEPRSLHLFRDTSAVGGPIADKDTRSHWDIAGRAIDGPLKDWTLEWVDSVQTRWFAWAAEHPRTAIYENKPAAQSDPRQKTKEIAGTAEFLRLLPKPFATLNGVDPAKRTATLVLDGEKAARVWPVEPDAEIKVAGWWGRLEQFQPGQRVWAWLKLDRKKRPLSVIMLADEVSEFDMHGRFSLKAGQQPRFADEEIEKKQRAQKMWLQNEWAQHGLPGSLMFHHVFSGELEIALDHEAMRAGRALAAGDEVVLLVEPPIKAVVKNVSPWRERTMVRLVVGELESSDLKAGQRLGVKIASLSSVADDDPYPLDMGRPRTKNERLEWFLASIYCTCPINKDTCTGQFYTLSSCNPNGCGMPNQVREKIGAMIDQGMTDRHILDQLRKDLGPLFLRPHLMP
jgi:hypothetical protein